MTQAEKNVYSLILGHLKTNQEVLAALVAHSDNETLKKTYTIERMTEKTREHMKYFNKEMS